VEKKADHLDEADNLDEDDDEDRFLRQLSRPTFLADLKDGGKFSSTSAKEA